jgi:acylphosphatase
MRRSDQDQARLRLIVSGRVQGVFFRGSAADQARKLGLTGYARNCHDGTVEIVAEGHTEALKSIAHWAKKGPPHARVEHLSEQWLPFAAEFDAFCIA